MERNGVFSLILTLTALDNLFNVLLAGILFIFSVTGHHHLSLILCLPSPAVITQPRPFSLTPGRHYPSPAVPYSPPHNPGRPISPTVSLNSLCHMCPTMLGKA